MLTFNATGAEAAEALTAIEALADDYFGNPIVDAPVASAVADVAQVEPQVQVLTGVPVSHGVAVAPVAHVRFKLPLVEERRIGDVRPQHRLEMRIEHHAQ